MRPPATDPLLTLPGWQPPDEPGAAHRRDPQIRLDTEGRAHYRRKLDAGKSRMGAMRCLKRRISDAVYRQLLADARAATVSAVADDPEMGTDGAGPGGQGGATLKSSAVELPPHIDTLRRSHFPDP